MPRFNDYVPHGVIPATLLALHDDGSIDERGTRRHLRDVAATRGLSAITVNGHAPRCTPARSRNSSASST